MWKALLQRGLAAGTLMLTVVVVRSASAQTVDNLLLVVNDSSPVSVEIGQYYAAKRQVDPGHIVHITIAPADTIERAEYLKAIEAPLAGMLTRQTMQDQILYLVLTKGVPLRIAGTGDRDGTLASVDSELTLLYRKLIGLQPNLTGRVDNPYYLGDRAARDAAPFTRLTSDIYLVTRLDGFTVDDVKGLIDRGVAPVADGGVVLDERAVSAAELGGDRWLEQTSDRLREMNAGDRVVLDTGRSMATSSQPVIGYYSWGSNDSAIQTRKIGLSFAAGAIGAMFLSTDGRTFAEPPADWVPTTPNGLGRPFAGTFESLAGDLIREGVTGVSAAVAEPFLDATIRPQILFPAYLSGFNLAESFYLATPFLSWRTIVVGDPLCRPFPRVPLTPAEISEGLDPDTEWPALFSARRLANMVSATGLKPDALKTWLKVESRVALGNGGVEALLVDLTGREPRFSAAQLRLAELYDTRGDSQLAAERYRQVIAIDPQNAAALNNLAYLLAERLQSPADALPFAERAYAIAPDPRVADTLGWTHHLLGNDRTALPFIERAVAGDATADILVHAALVRAALGDRARATDALTAARKLDPRIDERTDVKTLVGELAQSASPGSAPAPDQAPKSAP